MLQQSIKPLTHPAAGQLRRRTAWSLSAELLTAVIAVSFDGSLAAVVTHAVLAGLVVAGLGVTLGMREWG